jgi:hypothetical protein
MKTDLLTTEKTTITKKDNIRMRTVHNVRTIRSTIVKARNIRHIRHTPVKGTFKGRNILTFILTEVMIARQDRIAIVVKKMANIRNILTLTEISEKVATARNVLFTIEKTNPGEAITKNKNRGILIRPITTETKIMNLNADQGLTLTTINNNLKDILALSTILPTMTPMPNTAKKSK